MKSLLLYSLVLLISVTACGKNDNTTSETAIETPPTEGNASISNVSVSGEENEYTFSVTIKSSDLGCNQYADWWEVVSENGTLLYRRILAHSHVNEQPFTRSGGSVKISKDQEVYIRAHMNNTGYGEVVFKGSVSNGFSKQTLAVTFANELENIEPLPGGCAF